MYPPVVVDNNAPKPPKVSNVSSTSTLCCMVLIYLQSLQLQPTAKPFYRQSQQKSLVLEKVKEQANILLDTGAQVSLIRTSIAKELGLTGTNVTITIAKVGGEEEQLDTKVYEVRIRSLENRSAHVVKAIGIPSISNNTSTVNFDEMARVFGITKSKFWRNDGPVDVLIGIDNPLLHTGETRQRKSLIARHSPLGWVLFGTTP